MQDAGRQVGRQSLARADALTWLDAATGCKTNDCMHCLLTVRSVRADNSSSSATFALSLRGKTKQKKFIVSRGGTGFVLHINSSRSHWLFVVDLSFLLLLLALIVVIFLVFLAFVFVFDVFFFFFFLLF